MKLCKASPSFVKAVQQVDSTAMANTDDLNIVNRVLLEKNRYGLLPKEMLDVDGGCASAVPACVEKVIPSTYWYINWEMVFIKTER